MENGKYLIHYTGLANPVIIHIFTVNNMQYYKYDGENTAHILNSAIEKAIVGKIIED